MAQFVLYGEPGWGSTIIEAQLVWYGLPYEYRVIGDVLTDAAKRDAFARVNPLAQTPALILEDGTLMTESAAITLWLAERQHSDELTPAPNAPERAAFLRWLIFVVANIYPTFTYGDVPARFVSVEAAQQPFLDTLNEYAKRMYAVMEEAASDDGTFLPGRFSALDIYLGVLTQWRPRRDWFSTHTPKLWAAARSAHRVEQLREVWSRNYPKLEF